MDKNMNKEQLVEQTEEVAGGKVIESKDGKFYVIPNKLVSFSTEQDAKNAEQILNSHKIQSHRRPLPMVVPQNYALTPVPVEHCEKGLMTTKTDKKSQNPITTLEIKPEIK